MPQSATRRRLLILTILAIVVFAIGIRATYALTRTGPLESDARTYHRLATQLLNHGYLGYSADHLRSWRPPLYPAFLAGVYGLAGVDPMAPRLLQAGLSGLTVLLLALLAIRWRLPWAGALGAALFAAQSFDIRHSVDLYPECIILCLLGAYVLLGQGSPGRWTSLARAALAGAVVHLQPGLLAIPVAEVLWRLVAHRTRRERVSAAILLLGVVVSLVPWAIRNHAVHGEFVLVSTNGGFNLLKGNNPRSTGAPPSRSEEEYVRQAVAERGDMTEVERDKALRRVAVDGLRADPARGVGLALRRAWHWFWPSYFIEGPTGWIVTYGTVLPFALLGLALLLIRRVEIGLVLVVIAASALPAVLVVYVGQRYREPALPFVCLFAGVGIMAILRRAWRALRRPRSA